MSILAEKAHRSLDPDIDAFIRGFWIIFQAFPGQFHNIFPPYFPIPKTCIATKVDPIDKNIYQLTLPRLTDGFFLETLRLMTLHHKLIFATDLPFDV